MLIISRKFVGIHKDDKRNGQGTFTYPDGGKYVGNWKDGKEHGQGTLTWFNGDKYVGEWKDGKENGQGTTFLSDGGKYVGSFWNGKVFTGTRTDKNGKVIGKFYIGSESYTQFRNPQNRGEREWNSEMAADHEHE